MLHKGEAVHMTISVVTISLAFYILFLRLGYPVGFHIIFLTLGLGFIMHELAHKFVAMSFGCIAVYKAWMEGLVIALLFALFTPFVFAAPGAVWTYKEHLTRRENGLINIAGPVTNIILALLFFMMIGIPALGELGMWGFRVNAFLAFFNLIPFPPLDGSKVIRWNPAVWAGVFLFALVLVFFPGALL